jgi:aminomuconate-semialdehyde/2-hydroxymuconate-6-semialdehyde dehydrogenase
MSAVDVTIARHAGGGPDDRHGAAKRRSVSDQQCSATSIDGEEVGRSTRAFEVWNPWTRQVWASASDGGPEDAARAVASSRRAFDDGPWPRMKRVERAAALHRLADLMDERAGELATLDTRNMGKPYVQALHDVGRSVANFRFFADHQRDHCGEVYPMDSGHHTYSEYGPVGVVTAISPWNFPLMMATWKIAPAIAWGNTCVIKPSEDTPASVTMLGRLAVEADLPPRAC